MREEKKKKKKDQHTENQFKIFKSTSNEISLINHRSIIKVKFNMEKLVLKLASADIWSSLSF